MKRFKKFIFVDVEAIGASPAMGKMTEFGAVDFETRKTFHGILFKSTPDPDNPAKPLDTDERVNSTLDVAKDFKQWLDELGGGRAIFISDNPAYDWQWVSYMFDLCGIDNPFGHSGRRISDFWAGFNNKWGETQSWKRFRKTPHDHNPVNDAMGNVEAFEHIMQLVEERNARHAG